MRTALAAVSEIIATDENSAAKTQQVIKERNTMYISDLESVRKQSKNMERLNEAFIRSNGMLRIRLKDQSWRTGRYFGCQLTPSSGRRLSLQGIFGDAEGDYVDFFDVLQVEDVEAIV